MLGHLVSSRRPPTLHRMSVWWLANQTSIVWSRLGGVAGLPLSSQAAPCKHHAFEMLPSLPNIEQLHHNYLTTSTFKRMAALIIDVNSGIILWNIICLCHYSTASSHHLLSKKIMLNEADALLYVLNSQGAPVMDCCFPNCTCLYARCSFCLISATWLLHVYATASRFRVDVVEVCELITW